MRNSALLAALLIAVAAFVAGCKSGDGPLLINASGRTVELVVHSTDGTTFEGACADQAAVWAGKSRARTSRIEIRLGGATHVIEAEALNTPYGRDATTAFIIEPAGPRQLTLDEARILMRRK